MNLRPTAALALMLCVACAAQPKSDASPSPSPTSSADVTVVTPAPDFSKPAWTRNLPAAARVDNGIIADGLLIVSGMPGLLALEARTGARRWQTSDAPQKLVIENKLLVYGLENGVVRARRFDDGEVVWERKLCEGAQWHGVSIVSAQGNDILVGCGGGGSLALLDGRTGQGLARSDAFLTDKVDGIAPIGRCAYAVSGYSDGAALRNQVEIVDCKRLGVIMDTRTDATVLGAVGNTAIVDDWCCNGRPDEYRPATVYHVDLATGAESPKIDLRPEPERYPNPRPIGQGASASLHGTHLYLKVDDNLYDYGDARAPRASPLPIPPSSATPSHDGSSSYDTIAHSRVYQFGSGTSRFGVNEYVRDGDGARLTLSGMCVPLASSTRELVTSCLPPLSAKGSTLYIAAYNWR